MFVRQTRNQTPNCDHLDALGVFFLHARCYIEQLGPLASITLDSCTVNVMHFVQFNYLGERGSIAFLKLAYEERLLVSFGTSPKHVEDVQPGVKHDGNQLFGISILIFGSKHRMTELIFKMYSVREKVSSN